MADKIRLLPEVVANQIAAGEVVNRPASVVKEMMENAIDAGATSVKVNFRDGGKDLIQIVDDGCGMSPIDARMAFDRHATSKIGAVEDIYALHTFGFRGEALASIAAVSQVELRTRQAGDEVGTQTEINGGQFAAQNPVMCPVGSQFFVRNLFYNVPARRRFLDKSTTSASQIKAEFQRIALCNPQIAFELYANDAPVYTLQAGSLAGRIVDVVGRHIKQNLLEVEADTSIACIEGYIGRPAAAKKRNTEQYLFVNGRFFKSTYLTSAILKAYEKLIPESCQPSYFLYLTLDPGRIDVNVHPQKTEVKFADEEAVWQIVHAAVRETLARTGAVPMMDFTAEGRIEIPVARQGAVYDEPAAMVNEHYNPFAEGYVAEGADEQCGDVEEFPGEDFTEFPGPTPRGGRPAAGGDVGASRRGAAPHPAFDPVGEYLLSDREGGYDEVPSSAVAPDDAAVPFAGMADVPSSLGGGAVVAEDDAQRSVLEYVSSEDAAVQQRLIETPAAEFRSVTSVAPGYVVAMLGGVLVVVDLKRAQERLLYEYYLLMLTNGSAVSEQLLFPERLVLSHDEYELLGQYAAEFAAVGFDIERVGDGAIDVKGTPADMPSDTIDELIYQLLQTFAHVSAADLRRQRIAAELARSGARPMGSCTSQEEAERLLGRLQEAGGRCFSPAGKPILAEITLDELRAKLR